MMNQPLVSVCIPTYNNSQYLFDSVGSIINQRYKNIEIIIADNASTDNTEEKVKSLMQKDERIIYFRNSENLGFVGNCQKVVQRASSEYIAIYHSDDIYYPEILEKQLQILLEHSDVAAVFTGLENFGKETGILDFTKYELDSLLDISCNAYIGGFEDFSRSLLKNGNFFTAPSLFIRKNAFIEGGGFDETYFPTPDVPLWIRILKNGNKMAVINEILVKYRNSETHDTAIFGRELLLSKFYQVLDDLVLPEASKRDVLNYRKMKAKNYIDAANNAIKLNDKKNYDKLIEKSLESYTFTIGSNEWMQQHSEDKYIKFLKKIKRRIRKYKEWIF